MVIDLFSGCGGLSLGFKTAGFEIAGHVDNDIKAYKTASYNIPGNVKFDGNTDVQEFLNNEALVSELKKVTDVIIGGPPCQAYSNAGRGKLASLKGSKGAHLEDERGSLYIHFVNAVEVLSPRVVLMENVPDILNYGGVNIAEHISSLLHLIGYDTKYTVLNALNYGIPQGRERLFILAYRKELNIKPSFPEPVSYYEGRGRRYNAKLKSLVDSGESSYAMLPPLADELANAAVTTREALEDLPFISTLSGEEWKFGQNVSLAYRDMPRSQYSRLMRTWPGYEANGTVRNNTCRNTPRDFPTFQKMKPGDRYTEAVSIAEERYMNAIAQKESALNRELTEKEKAALKKEIIPPYARDKFHDKWRKLMPDQPSHTVVAHLSVDTYSHIHYDSLQARGITVREAARLQSFPDGFAFSGSIRDAYKQIGNAVPPLLALYLAKKIAGDTLIL